MSELTGMWNINCSCCQSQPAEFTLQDFSCAIIPTLSWY